MVAAGRCGYTFCSRRRTRTVLKPNIKMKRTARFMCPALAALLLVAGCSKDNDPIPVSGVELGKSAIELAVGQTERLSVTVLPDDASDQVVTWSSNDEAVATVGDNGTVTAVAEGTATITATAGGKYCSKRAISPTRSISLSER